MKKLSLQWRITLMTALLIGATCIFMNVLIGYSGRHYMDSIGSHITGYEDTEGEEPDFFDPGVKGLTRSLPSSFTARRNPFSLPTGILRRQRHCWAVCLRTF